MIVHNIPKNLTRLALYKLVAAYGKIKDFNIRYNMMQEPAFLEVTYVNSEDASKAKRELRRKKVNDHALYVMVSFID